MSSMCRLLLFYPNGATQAFARGSFHTTTRRIPLIQNILSLQPNTNSLRSLNTSPPIRQQQQRKDHLQFKTWEPAKPEAPRPKSDPYEAPFQAAMKELSQMSLYGKFKVLVRDYWYISMNIHAWTSMVWFGAIYLVYWLFFDPQKVIDFAQPYLDWARERFPSVASFYANYSPGFLQRWLRDYPNLVACLLVTTVIHKLIGPLRTLASVYLSMWAMRALRRKGYNIRPTKNILASFTK